MSDKSAEERAHPGQPVGQPTKDGKPAPDPKQTSDAKMPEPDKMKPAAEPKTTHVSDVKG